MTVAILHIAAIIYKNWLSITHCCLIQQHISSSFENAGKTFLRLCQNIRNSGPPVCLFYFFFFTPELLLLLLLCGGSLFFRSDWVTLFRSSIESLYTTAEIATANCFHSFLLPYSHKGRRGTVSSQPHTIPPLQKREIIAAKKQKKKSKETTAMNERDNSFMRHSDERFIL